MAGVAASRAVDDDSDGGDISGEDTLMAMVILSLDTTTRAGSVAVMRDDQLLASRVGNPNQTHGERLPGDILRILADVGLLVRDVELFAVCSGPGSFTGLRVGLATIQALALTGGRLVVPISTLEALAHSALQKEPSIKIGTLIVPWVNAYRGEVFGAVYLVGQDSRVEELRPPVVGCGSDLLEDWKSLFVDCSSLFIGDAVSGTKSVIRDRVEQASLESEIPELAPVIVRRASILRETESVRPHAVKPIYVRRPDAELARERAVERLEK